MPDVFTFKVFELAVIVDPSAIPLAITLITFSALLAIVTLSTSTVDGEITSTY